MGKKEFGKLLLEARNAKGLTQEEVAEACDITVRTIQRIEAGDVNPRAFTIRQISDFLEIDYYESSNTSSDEEDSGACNSKKHARQSRVKDLFNSKKDIMKKISILTTLFLLVGLTCFTLFAEAKSDKRKPNYVNTEKEIFVRFVPEFTIDSLIDIRQDLQKREIFLHYRKLDFDRFGRLRAINLELETNDRSAGSLSCPSVADDNSGFHFEFRENGKGYSLRIGKLVE